MCPGPHPQPGAKARMGLWSSPQPGSGAALPPPPPAPLTSPWVWRLMFCGWAPVMATQDSLRLHSQWPLSSARGHSAFLVQLQGQGGSLSLAPVSPWAGAGLDPQIQGGAEPPALTGPRRRTSHSRGPVSCGNECSWRSLHTPAREAGTPGGTRASSMTPGTSERGAPQTMMPGSTGSTLPFPTKPQEPQHRRKAEQGRLQAAQTLELARDQLAPGSKEPALVTAPPWCLLHQPPRGCGTWPI